MFHVKRKHNKQVIHMHINKNVDNPVDNVYNYVEYNLYIVLNKLKSTI